MSVVVKALWCEVVFRTVLFVCADRLSRRCVCWRVFYLEVQSCLEVILRGGIFALKSGCLEVFLRGGSVRFEVRVLGGPDLM